MSFGLNVRNRDNISSISIDGMTPISYENIDEFQVFTASHSLGITVVNESIIYATYYKPDTSTYTSTSMEWSGSGSSPTGEIIIDIENKKVYLNDLDITNSVTINYVPIENLFDNISGIQIT